MGSVGSFWRMAEWLGTHKFLKMIEGGRDVKDLFRTKRLETTTVQISKITCLSP
jgi:hypothetical protein